jgi:hypothetical protein
MLRALQKSFKDVTSNRVAEDVDQRSQEPVTQKRGKEDSMEEILASIRRIIPDDQILPLLRSLSAPGHSIPSERVRDAEVYHSYGESNSLQPASGKSSHAPVQDHLRRNPRKSSPQRAAGPSFRPDIEPVQRAAPELPTRFLDSQATHVDQMEQVNGSLVSPGSDISVSSSFNALATAVVLQNEGLVEESVRVVIRPIVKPWLEDNLAGIVESLVRQEIDRILRGRR